MRDRTGEYDERKAPAQPKAYAPRFEGAAAKAIPMPAWARTFAQTGNLPPESARRSNASELGAETVKEHGDRATYETRWRAIQRESGFLKGEAARVFLVNPPASALAKAASARGFELDEEMDRLDALYRKGAPLAMRSFPPLDVPLAGASLDRAERAAAREPLFVAPPEDLSEFIV